MTKRRMRMALAVAAVALAGCGGSGGGASSSTHTIHGTLAVAGFGGPTNSGDGCDGTGTDNDKSVLGEDTTVSGYSDLVAGGEVVVKDGKGATVATGELSKGKVSGKNCEMPFTVADVPAADFYKVEVTHRDGVTVKRTKLEADGWKVTVSVGN